MGDTLEQRTPARQQIPVLRQVAIVADLVEHRVRFQGRSSIRVIYRLIGEDRERQISNLVSQVSLDDLQSSLRIVDRIGAVDQRVWAVLVGRVNFEIFRVALFEEDDGKIRSQKALRILIKPGLNLLQLPC